MDCRPDQPGWLVCHMDMQGPGYGLPIRVSYFLGKAPGLTIHVLHWDIGVG